MAVTNVTDHASPSTEPGDQTPGGSVATLIETTSSTWMTAITSTPAARRHQSRHDDCSSQRLAVMTRRKPSVSAML
jgi:hypothetical protein